MAIVFYDFNDIIFIDYLEKEKTMNGKYYANLLQKLIFKIETKHTHFK